MLATQAQGYESSAEGLGESTPRRPAPPLPAQLSFGFFWVMVASSVTHIICSHFYFSIHRFEAIVFDSPPW